MYLYIHTNTSYKQYIYKYRYVCVKNKFSYILFVYKDKVNIYKCIGQISVCTRILLSSFVVGHFNELLCFWKGKKVTKGTIQPSILWFLLCILFYLYVAMCTLLYFLFFKKKEIYT